MSFLASVRVGHVSWCKINHDGDQTKGGPFATDP